MCDDIVSESELGHWLKLSEPLVKRLLAETALPRFFLAGEPRFIKSKVIAFFARDTYLEFLPLPEPPAEEVLLPVETDPSPPIRPVNVAPLPTALEGEHSWVPAEAREALSLGAADPGRNLDRLKLRDALLELNDLLLPALTRLSTGRLHPHYDEKSRTSPWRLDFDVDARIHEIGIAWGAGEHAPPRFHDRPHIEVELQDGHLRVLLDASGRMCVPELTSEELAMLAEAGFEVSAEAQLCTISKTYPMPDPTPPTNVVARHLEADLERLVPLWTRLV